MEKKLNGQGSISILLSELIYIIYILFLILSDWLSLGLFYLNSNIVMLGVAMAFIITMSITLFLRKYFVIKKANIDFLAGCAIVFLFITGLVRSIIPDLSYDTLNGRVFWQFPGFQDNIDYNTFPAGFTFFFPLSDRIFYYLRILLGYRLGTLVNTFVLILIYLEVRELLKELLEKPLQNIRKELNERSKTKIQYSFGVFTLNESVLALIACCLYYAIMNLGTYMIDLMALPFLLYLLQQLLKKECDSQLIQLGLFAFLCGCCFALKMPNMIFIAPILILYLIKNRRYIKWYTFVICLLLGIFPSFPYLLYAYISTGNPVYWTYNSIFKSPYYIDADFKDMRWGPENFKDLILWPLRLVFNYEERVSEISKSPQIYLLFGVLGSFIILFRSIKSKVWDKKYVILIGIFYIICYLWLSSTGYSRYAIICEIIASILAFIAITNLLQSPGKISTGIAYVLLLCLIVQFQYNAITGINNAYDWSWRGTTVNNLKNGVLADNAKWLLRDRGKIGSDEQREKVDIFLETGVSSQLMKNFDPDIPIINASYILGYLGGVKEQKGIDYPGYYKDKINSAIQNGAGVYDIRFLNQLEEACNLANQWGVEIVGCEKIDSYYTTTLPVLIQYTTSGNTNTFTALNTTQILENLSANKEQVSLNGIVYLNYYEQNERKLEIIVTKEGVQSISEVMLQPKEFYNLHDLINISGLTASDQVVVNIEEGATVYAINLWLE